jgi:hypothetical protein
MLYFTHHTLCITPYIVTRQDLRYARGLYLTQVQVLYDSRTERNTDLNSSIVLCPCSFPSVSREFSCGLAILRLTFDV